MAVVVGFKGELPSAEMKCIYFLNSTWINIVTHAVVKFYNAVATWIISYKKPTKLKLFLA